MIDYTFHLLYKKLAAKYELPHIERHWDKLVQAAWNRRERGITQ